ncbi:MAG: DsbA family protein [Magnetovibrio sp.]|nr:DsbA family protein [Magnetovibrio sp.]
MGTVERIAIFIALLAFVVAGGSGFLYFEQQKNNQPAELSQQQVRTALAAHQADLTRYAGDPVLGNLDGAVTLVGFFDYNCTYCKAVHPDVMRLLESDPTLRYVAKEFPVLGPVSTFASQAALASQKQNGYKAFNLALMKTRLAKKEQVLLIAKASGLDVDRLKSDMDTYKDEINATLDNTFALAKVLALKGTPAFIAGDRLVAGTPTLGGLKKLVDLAR